MHLTNFKRVEKSIEMALKPCCCISLRTGAHIIGIFQIIISAMGIAFTLMMLREHVKIISDLILRQQLTEEIIHTYADVDPETISYWVRGMWYVYVIVTCIIMVCMVDLFLASILIHGIRTENLKLLKFYLIAYATLVCVSLVGAIFLEFYLFAIILFGLSLYSLLVIYHAYLEVREKVAQSQSPVVKHVV